MADLVEIGGREPEPQGICFAASLIVGCFYPRASKKAMTRGREVAEKILRNVYDHGYRAGLAGSADMVRNEAGVCSRQSDAAKDLRRRGHRTQLDIHQMHSAAANCLRSLADRLEEKARHG